MKYKLIKNFLTQEEINLCTDYCRIQHRLNKFNFDNQNSNFDSSLWRSFNGIYDVKQKKVS